MKTHELNHRATLQWPVLCAILGALLVAVLTTSCATSSTSVKEAAALPLLNTQWRLTHLGPEVINNPAGEHAIHFLLQPSSTNVVGFSGCNRMFGRYVLEGPLLRFDGLGGTRMFCEGRMQIEERFLTMFSQVARWEIAGAGLRLLDGDGKTVATFEASPP
jgi:heat shock protein HslJ